MWVAKLIAGKICFIPNEKLSNESDPTNIGNYDQMARQARPLEDQHHQCLSPSLNSHRCFPRIQRNPLKIRKQSLWMYRQT